MIENPNSAGYMSKIAHNIVATPVQPTLGSLSEKWSPTPSKMQSIHNDKYPADKEYS